MPREKLNYVTYQEYLGVQDLRHLKSVTEAGGSHTENFYEIDPSTTKSEVRKCDICAKKGRFLHHTRDHMAQNWVVIACDQHAPPGFGRMLEAKLAQVG